MNVCRRILRSSLHLEVWSLMGMAVLLSAGCGSSGGRVISLDNTDLGRSVVVAAGDKIEVTLQTVGPGQYGDPVISSGSVRYLEESDAAIANPGGPRQIYRFEAVASGRAVITITHTGGFPNEPATPAFTLTVSVQ